jgi:hypothetical protein
VVVVVLTVDVVVLTVDVVVGDGRVVDAPGVVQYPLPAWFTAQVEPKPYTEGQKTPVHTQFVAPLGYMKQ